jgi:glutathione gamma-glutamylcysteinyltransferase
MENTLYRRPLPAHAVPFSSSEGRQLFAEALAAGGLEGYFPLAEQFHTQSDPAFCGLGSLVVALNALSIDPGRLWKGPWRWFAEDLLDCCVPLEQVRARGLSLDELGCLASCNGAEVELRRGTVGAESLADFRDALARSSRAEEVLIAAYDRAALGQTGGGHFSPIGGYHAARDLALVLDVARFKYPAHWLPVERLWQAMQTIDSATGLARGWLLLRARRQGIALGFSFACEGESWRGLAERVRGFWRELAQAEEWGRLAPVLTQLAEHIQLRQPSAPAHQQALASARAALREHPAYEQVGRLVHAEHVERVLILLLVLSHQLTPVQRAQLGISGPSEAVGPLSEELDNLRAQLTAVMTVGA